MCRVLTLNLRSLDGLRSLSMGGSWRTTMVRQSCEVTVRHQILSGFALTACCRSSCHQFYRQSSSLQRLQSQFSSSVPSSAVRRVLTSTAGCDGRRHGRKWSTSDHTSSLLQDLHHEVGDLQDDTAWRFTADGRHCWWPDCCQFGSRVKPCPHWWQSPFSVTVAEFGDSRRFWRL